MSLPPGRMLGPYEILSPIGAGGMGDQYIYAGDYDEAMDWLESRVRS